MPYINIPKEFSGMDTWKGCRWRAVANEKYENRLRFSFKDYISTTVVFVLWAMGFRTSSDMEQAVKGGSIGWFVEQEGLPKPAWQMRG
jgi:hypothetical protein